MDIKLEEFRLIEAVMKIENVALIKEIKSLLDDKSDPVLGYDLEGKTILSLRIDQGNRGSREPS